MCITSKWRNLNCSHPFFQNHKNLVVNDSIFLFQFFVMLVPLTGSFTLFIGNFLCFAKMMTIDTLVITKQYAYARNYDATQNRPEWNRRSVFSMHSLFYWIAYLFDICIFRASFILWWEKILVKKPSLITLDYPDLLHAKVWLLISRISFFRHLLHVYVLLSF